MPDAAKTAKKNIPFPKRRLRTAVLPLQTAATPSNGTAERSVLLLKNNESGHIWSTVPYDYYLSGGTSVNLNSPLFIEYYTPRTDLYRPQRHIRTAWGGQLFG
ncbi:MAG: hypothetical protein ACLR56_00135 [Oscillospiraceae bacterium]